jgi:hypothetical protein
MFLTMEGLFVVLGVCGVFVLGAAVQLVVEVFVNRSAATAKAAPEVGESSGWEAKAA